jgi:hypothetical protein
MAAGALLPKIFQTDWQSTSTSSVLIVAIVISQSIEPVVCWFF